MVRNSTTDGFPSNNLKEMLGNILKIMTCRVCYNSLRPPVAVCENGHLTCPQCRAKISTCPLCKQPFQSLRIRQLDEVLEVIPHQCRFEGCQVLMTPEEEHEKWCSYRTTDCKVETCFWKGSVRGLAEHFRKDHEIDEILSEVNNNWVYYDFNPNEISTNLHSPVLAHGQVFWMHTTNNVSEKLFKIAFYCFPVDIIVDSFQFKVTLKKDKKKYSTSIFMLPENFMNEEENCICLPSPFVQTFVDNKKKLKFSMSIKKK